MQIVRFSLGDTLRLKKPHPCGNADFRVLRVGSDIRLLCLGCGRDLTLPRFNLEKMIKTVFPKEEPLE